MEDTDTEQRTAPRKRRATSRTTATGRRGGVPQAPDLEGLDAAGVIAFAVERYHPRLTVACSFQKEASVILDLALKAAPDIRVFTLDTHVLFPETYETWKNVEERYGIRVNVHSGPSLGRQAAVHGDELWERDPDACCDLRKVQPAGSTWPTPTRGSSRSAASSPPARQDGEVAWDAKNGLVEDQPARRLDQGRRAGATSIKHGLPYNQLHDQGYSASAASHCTKPDPARTSAPAAGRAPPRASAACTPEGGRAASAGGGVAGAAAVDGAGGQPAAAGVVVEEQAADELARRVQARQRPAGRCRARARRRRRARRRT